MSKNKQAGVIVGGLMIALALLIFLLTKIDIDWSKVKKNEGGKKSTVVTTSGFESLSEVLDKRQVIIKNKLLETNTKVVAKRVYVFRGQLIYGVEFKLNGESCVYFCTRSDYDTLRVGMEILVKYEEVQVASSGNKIAIKAILLGTN